MSKDHDGVMMIGNFTSENYDKRIIATFYV